MARSSRPPLPQPDRKLTIDELRAGVARLSRRLEELQAFNPQQMQEKRPNDLISLAASITDALALTFGADTMRFHRFKAAGNLLWVPGYIGSQPTPLSDYQNGVARGVASSCALISAAIKILEEEIIEVELAPKTPSTVAEGNYTKRVIDANKVFVVHGHDEGAKQGTARFLEKLKLEAIILDEKPSRGDTIIEKFERYAAEVGFAVVLLTPDDVGHVKTATSEQERVRQNVIFELGYFVGKLGRGRACLLRKGDVELPSDLAGVIYIDMDTNHGWHNKLVKEMKAANLYFDANRLWE